MPTIKFQDRKFVPNHAVFKLDKRKFIQSGRCSKTNVKLWRQIHIRLHSYLSYLFVSPFYLFYYQCRSYNYFNASLTKSQ